MDDVMAGKRSVNPPRQSGKQGSECSFLAPANTITTKLHSDPCFPGAGTLSADSWPHTSTITIATDTMGALTAGGEGSAMGARTGFWFHNDTEKGYEGKPARDYRSARALDHGFSKA
jgi:hypothetical protein